MGDEFNYFMGCLRSCSATPTAHPARPPRPRDGEEDPGPDHPSTPETFMGRSAPEVIRPPPSADSSGRLPLRRIHPGPPTRCHRRGRGRRGRSRRTISSSGIGSMPRQRRMRMTSRALANPSSVHQSPPGSTHLTRSRTSVIGSSRPSAPGFGRVLQRHSSLRSSVGRLARSWLLVGSVFLKAADYSQGHLPGGLPTCSVHLRCASSSVCSPPWPGSCSRALGTRR